jgi:hypothetical protein
MRKLGRRLLLIAMLAAAGYAVWCWPRLNDVETGRTKEYAALQPVVYHSPPERVFATAKDVTAHLPGWTTGGSGSGPAGWTLQATHSFPVVPPWQEITIRITREGRGSRVSVHSRSRWEPWDFGQNARNIRAFYRGLDEALAR